MAEIARDLLEKLGYMEKAGVLNPFYDALYRDMSHIMMTREKESMQRLFVVKPNGEINFDKAHVDKFYKTKYKEATMAKTISKQLTTLLHTPNMKAEFAYATVDPWEHSKAVSCYHNVGRFCAVNPNYQPLYVYTIWDQGSFYELEPHALVQERNTQKVRDITPTVEVLLGKPCLSKVCYVFHPTLQGVLCSANSWKIQYGFIVEKNKGKK
ncbi:MAG: hypothetical protein SGILL_006378 [Bacillariaceae sp.]